jgi:hypothetical protein
MSKTAPARPRLPSGLSVALLIAKMSLRRARRGKLLRVVAVLLLLPPATVLIGVLSGRSGGQMFEFALELFLRYLAPLALALGASASVAEEAQAKTITYLFTRPMPRWALPFGKFLSTAAANSVLLLISLVICFGVAMIGGPQGVLDRLALLGSGMFALVLAALYFGAMAKRVRRNGDQLAVCRDADLPAGDRCFDGLRAANEGDFDVHAPAGHGWALSPLHRPLSRPSDHPHRRDDRPALRHHGLGRDHDSRHFDARVPHRSLALAACGF